MSDTTFNQPAAEDTSFYEAEVDRYLGEMQRLEQQMQDDRREIDTLKAETQAIIADIMHTLKVA